MLDSNPLERVQKRRKTDARLASKRPRSGKNWGLFSKNAPKGASLVSSSLYRQPTLLGNTEIVDRNAGKDGSIGEVHYGKSGLQRFMLVQPKVPLGEASRGFASCLPHDVAASNAVAATMAAMLANQSRFPISGRGALSCTTVTCGSTTGASSIAGCRANTEGMFTSAAS